MKTEKPDNTARIQIAMQRLAETSAVLNKESDELSVVFVEIEKHLKKLNIGVSAWYQTAEGGTPARRWTRSVGYSRVKHKWCLAAKSVLVDILDQRTEELWALGEAPRWMRIEAVAHIPDLLETLLERTVDMIGQIKGKVKFAGEIVGALQEHEEQATDPDADQEAIKKQTD